MQLCCCQLGFGRKGRLQKLRVTRRLGAHIRQQPAPPVVVAAPIIQRFQQGQHRRAELADRPDKLVRRRCVQRGGQGRAPVVGFLAVTGQCLQNVQLQPVDVPLAGRAVGLQRGKRQQRGVGSARRQLGHGLRYILVALHDVEVQRVARGFGAVPGVGVVQRAHPQVDAAEQRVHVGQKPRLAVCRKPLPQGGDGAARVLRLAVGKLAARQQPRDRKFYVGRAPALDLAHGADQPQHPPGNILALFKLALGDGAVRQADAVFAQHGLDGNAQRRIQKVVLTAPIGEILAAVHDTGQRAGDGKRR